MGVFLRPFITHHWTVVGRAVVDEYHLKIVKILIQHTLNAPVECGFCVIYGDDDTQFHGHKGTNKRVKIQIYFDKRNILPIFAFDFK
jgi:hypothetical protein